jgi:heat-inducible transcriptional repressor
VQLPRFVSTQELEQTANYLNRHFSGLGFAQIRCRLLHEMQQAKSELDQLLNAALDISQQLLLQDNKPDDLLLSGQTRMMGVQGMSDMEHLRSLFDAFSQKREIWACWIVVPMLKAFGFLLAKKVVWLPCKPARLLLRHILIKVKF